MDKKQSLSFGFLEVLALIFITLKLLGKIEWSWWWVTAPLWGQLALAIGLIIFVLVIAALTGKKPNIQIGGRNNRQEIKDRLNF